MGQLTYKNKSINFNTIGDGAPLILLHGFCEDATMWEDFIPNLSNNYQYITIDLPGFGKSETIDNISIEDMADIVNAVLDELNIHKSIVIGHSMGGYVALAFAEKYASRLKGLGLFHSHPYADSPEKKADRAKHIQFVEKNGAIHFIKQLYQNLFVDGFDKFNTLAYNKLVYKASQYSNQGVVNALKAMSIRVDRSSVLENLSCPALFIIGRKDSTIDEEVAISSTTLVNKAVIEIIPEAGHMGMFEAPKQSSKAINDFLKICEK